MLSIPRTSFSLVILLLVSKLSSFAAQVTFNVEDFGAISGGMNDSSKAFLDAWAAACASKTPSIVYAPQGVFLLGNKTTFEGLKCQNHITLQIDGTIIAPSDYNVIGNNDHWISIHNTNSATISGGILDGQGDSLWKCKATGNQCPLGAKTLGFFNSRNIIISNLTIVRSQLFNMVIEWSRNITVQGLNISNPENSPNTDGIHMENSSNVTILSSNIATGDDCVSIGPGNSVVWIENVFCGPGHGISIGSLAKTSTENGVEHVTVKNVTVQNTENGVRIKTWARPSNGYVNNVTFQKITVNNARHPIIIDQNYCPRCLAAEGSTIKISNVTYQEIHGTSATKVAIFMNCNKVEPCQDITLEDINLTFGNQPAQASCSNVLGGVSSGLVNPTGCF